MTSIGEARTAGTDDGLEFRPYVQRWTAAERTCPCRTPWDGLKKGYGYHCAACCRNFRNLGVALMHQRWVGDPCKDPARVRDVTTGAPLLRCTVDGAWEIWG